jgi:hypothetical protein
MGEANEHYNVLMNFLEIRWRVPRDNLATGGFECEAR